jgi:hypothetical protein
MLRRPVSLSLRTCVSACALALAALENLDVRVRLVGQDGLEAMAVMIGERQLRARVRALAADEHSGARRPCRQVKVGGDLGDLRSR